MKVYYHKTAGGNVGDDMNAVLWQRIVPGLEELTPAEWLVGAGTIIDLRLNALPGRKIVMGSGFRWGAGQDFLRDDIHFAAVRGFGTAECCGLAPEFAVCDPGFLVSRVWPMARAPAGPVAFIPHIYSEQYSQIAVRAADTNFKVISPTLPLEEFLRQLAGCSRAYCESLHGAIFADALRVPWARVRICSHFYEGRGVSDFKWTDTFAVLGLTATSAIRETLIPMKRSWPLIRDVMRPLQSIAEKRLLGALAQRRDDTAVFQLSDPARLQERVDELMLRVAQLCSDDRLDKWSAAPGARRRTAAQHAQ